MLTIYLIGVVVVFCLSWWFLDATRAPDAPFYDALADFRAALIAGLLWPLLPFFLAWVFYAVVKTYDEVWEDYLEE